MEKLEDPLVVTTTKKSAFTYVFGILSLVFLITTIIFAVLYAKKETAPAEPDTPVTPVSPFSKDHTVEIRGQIFDDEIGGAAMFQGKYDLVESEYYPIVDFYNMKNTKSRTILEKFKTYQQTSDYSCQCASIIMVLDYYGDKSETEWSCMESMGWSKEDLKDPEIVYNHTERITLDAFIDYLKKIGYSVTTKFDYYNKETDEYDLPYDPEDAMSWANWVKETLKKGEPIIIQSSDWLGHVTVIIGYDDMGTEYGDDDVLIIADPFDTTDHLQDGYIIHSLQRFYEQWHYLDLPHIRSQDPKYWNDIFLVIHKKETKN